MKRQNGMGSAKSRKITSAFALRFCGSAVFELDSVMGFSFCNNLRSERSDEECSRKAITRPSTAPHKMSWLLSHPPDVFSGGCEHLFFFFMGLHIEYLERPLHSRADQ